MGSLVALGDRLGDTLQEEEGEGQREAGAVKDSVLFEVGDRDDRRAAVRLKRT